MPLHTILYTNLSNLIFNVIFGKVARLQLQVYEQLAQLKETGRYPNIKNALDELNSKLMDVTKVHYQTNYKKFVPLDLCHLVS